MAEPRWIVQTREIFDIMRKDAKLNEYHELIWEGLLSELYNEVGVASLHRPRVLKLLTACEAVRIVQRGNRYQNTVVEVTGKLQAGELLPPEHLTSDRHAATLVAEVEKRLAKLEAWRNNLEKGGLDVAKVLLDFELRLSKLEREVREIGKKAQDTE